MSYKFIEKKIHTLIFNNDDISKIFFELDCFLFERKAQNIQKNIFICGLARSGTTMFLNYVHSSGAIASPTYDDMPFLLSPNLYNFFSKFKSKYKSIERHHGDGVLFNNFSPEAFDEFFWRVFCGDEYIYENYLLTHDPNKKILIKYNKYLNLYRIKYNKNVLAIKNNNNLLRINTLSRFMKDSKFVVMVRNPYFVYQSLIRASDSLSKKLDKFSLSYMDSLVHNEFTFNFKYFNFYNKKYDLNEFSLDKFLDYWHEVYFYLYKTIKHKKNIFFVPYQFFCSSDSYRNDLNKALEIDNLKFNYKIKTKEERYCSSHKAFDLYNKIIDIS